MEILIILVIVVVFVMILGQSFLPLMVLMLGVMGLFAALCVVFFLVTAVLLIAARPKDATFVEVEKNDKGISFAIYEVDGVEYRNTFPTDGFLQKLLYRKKNVRVRFLHIKNIELVFDRVMIWITVIGLPVFALMAYAVFDLMRTV